MGHDEIYSIDDDDDDDDDDDSGIIKYSLITRRILIIQRGILEIIWMSFDKYLGVIPFLTIRTDYLYLPTLPKDGD